MRRSNAVRLTLLPILAAAGLARGQTAPDQPAADQRYALQRDCRVDDCDDADNDGAALFMESFGYDYSYLVVPAAPVRGGFGAYHGVDG